MINSVSEHDNQARYQPTTAAGWLKTAFFFFFNLEFIQIRLAIRKDKWLDKWKLSPISSPKNGCTVSPCKNMHALIIENPRFRHGSNNILVRLEVHALIFEYYVHALIFENYFAHHCVTQTYTASEYNIGMYWLLKNIMLILNINYIIILFING